MVRRAFIRASDRDREQVADRLRRAAAEGRLRPDELEERLGVALSALTYGELDAVVADLPRPDIALRQPSQLGPVLRAARTLVLLMVVLPIVVPLLIVGLEATLFVGHGMLIGWAMWVLVGWWMLRLGRRAGLRHRGRRMSYADRWRLP